ncbi:hypothetical protein DFP72DRAFT_895529 [Ephemerocybe angulata]|uniref:Uncharacterized protein n=1 Tax=Ephemerocybe angulata TaxID=980116 RepID=A0A8H6M8D9_9AGAR|nr:hypothetical protein DFP72DRAFT_895529 [Tulosesus angulatus]
MRHRSSSLGPMVTLSSPAPPPTIRNRSGTASGKVPVFQVWDGRTGRSRSPRPSQLTGPVRAHRSPSRSHRHKPSASTHMYGDRDRRIRSRSRSPHVEHRRRRRPSPEARSRSRSPIPRPVSIAYRTWSQRSRSHSPPRPSIVIQPQARRGSPAPVPVPIRASPIRIPSPPPLSPAVVPMQYPQVASKIVSPRPVSIQNRESLRLRSIPNRGDTASPVRSGSPRIRIPYISQSPPPVQHGPPLVQRSPPPLAQSPPMMQHQYSESSTGSTLVNQNTFDLRQTRPLYGTWGSGSTLVQANPTKSDRDALGFAEMSAPAMPLFSYASLDDKLRTTATPPDGKLPNV